MIEECPHEYPGKDSQNCIPPQAPCFDPLRDELYTVGYVPVWCQVVLASPCKTSRLSLKHWVGPRGQSSECHIPNSNFNSLNLSTNIKSIINFTSKLLIFFVLNNTVSLYQNNRTFYWSLPYLLSTAALNLS